MAKLILLNKPFNVLCQFTDKEGRATLADFIDEDGVYPAGRLDYDSEGLVLLTNDGKLQHQISHPERKMEKTYWAHVEGEPTESDLDRLRTGIVLNDGPCKPAKVSMITPPALWARNPPVRQRKSIPTSWLQLSISEGRNRQIRRMTAAIGYPTLRLVRYKIGPWSFDGLKPGEHKSIEIHTPTKKSNHRARTPKRRGRV